MIARVVLASLALVLTGPAAADNYVPGHFTKDGRYVEGHYRTSPNSTKLDNYSTKGNVNPYTGERGTKDADDLDMPRAKKRTYDADLYQDNYRKKKKY